MITKQCVKSISNDTLEITNAIFIRGYSPVPTCCRGGCNKMHQLENFLRWGGGGLFFRSFSCNNYMLLRVFFPQNLQFDPHLQLSTEEYKTYMHF